jgi:hypothetical protein
VNVIRSTTIWVQPTEPPKLPEYRMLEAGAWIAPFRVDPVLPLMAAQAPLVR